MESDEKVMEIFRESGALLEGHFILRSGLRSRRFFQCARVCEDLGKVGELARLLLGKLGGVSFETVVAPAMGGLVIGQEVARRAGARFLFVEKENDRLALRRNFQLGSGEKVLVVEDVVTRGGRAEEAIHIVRQRGAEPVALAVLVDRSGGSVRFSVPFVPLVSLEVETFPADDLPADLRDVPAIKPGS